MNQYALCNRLCKAGELYHIDTTSNADRPLPKNKLGEFRSNGVMRITLVH